jgi:methylmalonyl-CoA mutase N-terminal domain/subunit
MKEKLTLNRKEQKRLIALNEVEKKRQSGEMVIVGVNKFIDEQKQDEEIVPFSQDLPSSNLKS